MSVQIKAKVMWAQLNNKNEMSGKYQVDLTQLSDRAVEALEGMDIEVKYKDDKGSYITCKSTRPIGVQDTDGVSLAGIDIGNDSECIATVGSYAWKFKQRSGVSPSLNKFVITDLVEYEGSASNDDEDYDGEVL